MLEDRELEDLIENIDDSLVGLSVRHNVGISELTGAVMARLLLANQASNNEIVFTELLKSILNNPPTMNRTVQ